MGLGHNNRRILSFLRTAAVIGQQKSRFSSGKQVGAIIVKGSNILAVGANRAVGQASVGIIKSDGFIVMHAEVSACINIDNPKKLVGSDIFVGRFSKRKTLSLSRPCPSCQKYLAELKINRAFFINENNAITILQLGIDQCREFSPAN